MSRKQPHLFSSHTAKRWTIGTLVLVGVCTGTLLLWPPSSNEKGKSRPVHGSPNWPALVWKRLGKPEREGIAIDRVVIHAISPEIVRIDPNGHGTFTLGSLRTADLEAISEEQHMLSARYRTQSAEPLFPTDSDSIAHHVIAASQSLDRDESQQLLRLWRMQTMNCEQRDKISLCHGPHFALSMYSSQSLVLEVELCWFCQEARFTVGQNGNVSCDFAVDTPAAADLRTLLKQSFPSIPAEEG